MGSEDLHTPSSALRNWIILGAISLLVPSIFGLALYGFVRHSVIAKYDSCVRSLPDDQRAPRGLTMIVDDLNRLGGPKYSWNVNSPYRSGQLNILIPTSASDEWHAGCGLPTWPADCLAAASSNFIICNALVGRQLSNPLLVSGIAREEIVLARRFLALVIVGHEVGHLRAGRSGRLQHLFPTRRANGLKCRQRDNSPPTDEEKADQFGIELACRSIRADQDRGVGNDVGSAINTISALRNALDDDLFAFDDSCAGDDTYPSMSRRKSTFAHAYARCLYPGSDLPYAGLAADQDEAFRRLEEWLRSRQIGGFVASPEYGASPVYRYDVASTPSRNRFVAFDSSGTSSRVSITAVGDQQIQHNVLATWNRSGTLVGSRSDDMATELLASFPSGDDARMARHIVVRCSGQAESCKADVTDKLLPSGFELWPLTGKGVVMTSGRHLWSYASYADYIGDNALLTATSEIDLTEGSILIGGDADRLLLGRRPDDAELRSGLHRIAIVRRSETRWLTFSTIGTSMSPLRALGLFGNLAAFVFASDTAGFEAHPLLWLCPVDQLEAPGSRSVACDTHRAPEDLRYSVGLANNDLESLGTKVISLERCGKLIGVRQSGWLWLVDPANHLIDAVPGTGVISCSADRSSALIYRARRIDEVRLSPTASAPGKASIAIVQTGAP